MCLFFFPIKIHFCCGTTESTQLNQTSIQLNPGAFLRELVTSSLGNLSKNINLPNFPPQKQNWMVATQIFFMFIPNPGENDPIWRLHIYQMGLVLQPPTRLFTMYIYIYIPTYPNIYPPQKTQPEGHLKLSPRLLPNKGSFAPSTAFNRMRHAASALVNAGESPISPASWVLISTTRGFFVVLGVVLEKARSCFMFPGCVFWILLGFFFFWLGWNFGWENVWCCQVLWRRYFCIQMFHKMTFCVWGVGHIREEHMKQIGGVFESGIEGFKLDRCPNEGVT